MWRRKISQGETEDTVAKRRDGVGMVGRELLNGEGNNADPSTFLTEQLAANQGDAWKRNACSVRV